MKNYGQQKEVCEDFDWHLDKCSKKNRSYSRKVPAED
jgi:hypothetical protein